MENQTMGTEQGGAVPHLCASSAVETDLEVLASRNHYRRVVQSLSEGVFVQDHTGKILSVNAAAATILGMDLTAFPGQSTAGVAWDIVDEDGVAVAPGDRPGRRCIETGQPSVGDVF
jgi:PAS domain-containing protein